MKYNDRNKNKEEQALSQINYSRSLKESAYNVESKDIKLFTLDWDKASSMGIAIIAASQDITLQSAGRRNEMKVKDRNWQMQIQRRLC